MSISKGTAGGLTQIAQIAQITQARDPFDSLHSLRAGSGTGGGNDQWTNDQPARLRRARLPAGRLQNSSGHDRRRCGLVRARGGKLVLCPQISRFPPDFQISVEGHADHGSALNLPPLLQPLDRVRPLPGLRPSGAVLVPKEALFLHSLVQRHGLDPLHADVVLELIRGLVGAR